MSTLIVSSLLLGAGTICALATLIEEEPKGTAEDLALFSGTRCWVAALMSIPNNAGRGTVCATAFVLKVHNKANAQE